MQANSAMQRSGGSVELENRERPEPGPGAVAGLGRELAMLFLHPFRRIVLLWNWKAALLSASIRSVIFFAVNLTAGRQRAIRAMLVEGAYAALASGFFGAVTQNVREAQPAWLTGLFLSILLPLGLQALQLGVHWLMGTPRLRASMLASVGFAAVSALFHWYAMRRGTLLVGGEGRSFLSDLKGLPRLIWDFVTLLPRRLWRRATAARDGERAH